MIFKHDRFVLDAGFTALEDSRAPLITRPAVGDLSRLCHVHVFDINLIFDWLLGACDLQKLVTLKLIQNG